MKYVLTPYYVVLWFLCYAALGDYPGLDFRRGKPLKRLRQAGAVVGLIVLGPFGVAAQESDHFLGWRQYLIAAGGVQKFEAVKHRSHIGTQLAFAGTFLRVERVFESSVRTVQNNVLYNEKANGHENKENGQSLTRSLAAFLCIGLIAISFFLIGEGRRKALNGSFYMPVFLLAFAAMFAGIYLFFAGVMVWHELDPFYRRTEDVRVLLVVIPELELGNIEGIYFRLTLWR